MFQKKFFSLAEWLLKRPDGDLVRGVHPYRRIMPFIMPGRNESIVFYDDDIAVQPLLDYLHQARETWQTEVDIIHAAVAATSKGLFANPRMNQFIAGQRLYRRNHVAITFSMKRKARDKDAKLAAVKLKFHSPEEPFYDLCQRINHHIQIERSGKKTYADKELDLLTLLPRKLMRWAMKGVQALDYYNLLPASFIEEDPFFTSLFIANLGSLGMKAAFHHLYEYGTCPLFLMIGKIEEKPVVKDGQVLPQKLMHIRWSYDERIDDGLTSNYGMEFVKHCLEHPTECFGPIEKP